MRSSLPKVLHTLAGRPLVAHVIRTAQGLGAEKVAVVYGHGGEQVQQTMADDTLIWAEQAEQLGTGHAVEQAMFAMQDMDRVLVLYGDVPLTRAETLDRLIAQSADTALSLLTVTLDNPTGYGRIVREAGQVTRIVEQKDASPSELDICEINTGILIANREKLSDWLSRLESNNAQGEYYLTDIVAMAVAEGIKVSTAHPDDPYEVEGINDRVQLAALERQHQKNQADQLMRQGVTLRDPARFDLRGTLQAGQDSELDINVLIEGEVILGDRVRVGANTVIRNSQIADGVWIKEN
ncbi:MAG: NTP transferase domain-containing protein, partial [Sedimenticola sp.]|nr:NTP transferase domain-containing protein [Sedimenticola sp.]